MCWCNARGILICCVINIDAAALKVLPFDRPLKTTGQLTVLLVYESYYAVAVVS